MLGGLELLLAEKTGGAQATSVGDRTGDVVGSQVNVDFERAGEALQLRQQTLAEATAVELAPGSAAGRYGVSLLRSPGNSLSRSRLESLPWTSAAVRTPIPKSLMKPAAALWSNWSPLP